MSVASKRSSFKKRRYRELDGTCWEINNDAGSDSLVATSNQPRSSNKRTLKLEKKLLNRACQEADFARSNQRQLPQPSVGGIKHTESVTGVFSSVIIELTRNSLHCLAQRDQEAVYDTDMTEVDNIRLLKTNKTFYDRVVSLWLKFIYLQTVDSLQTKTPQQ